MSLTWGQAIGLIFAVQAVFILLDGWECVRAEQSAGLREVLRSQKESLFFILAVWSVFYAIQIGLAMLLPGADGVAYTMSAWLGVPPTLFFAPATITIEWRIASGLAVFVLAGFWDYAIHRWISHCRWFWFTHENHHLPSEINNLMPGISARPFTAFPSILTLLGCIGVTFLLLGFAGLPGFQLFLDSLPALLVISAVIGSASHSSFLRRFPIFHRAMRVFLITTPQEHILHHSSWLQCNYGNFSTLWDRLLGTYVAPEDVPVEDILPGLDYDQDFLGTLTFGRCKLPARWRERFELHRYCRLNETEIIEREPRENPLTTQGGKA